MRTTCRRTAALCERICCRLRGHALTYTCACAHVGARAMRECARARIRTHTYERPSLPPPPHPPPPSFRRSLSHHISMPFFSFPSSFDRPRDLSFFLSVTFLRLSKRMSIFFFQCNRSNVSCNPSSIKLSRFSLSRDYRTCLFKVPLIYN